MALCSLSCSEIWQNRLTRGLAMLAFLCGLVSSVLSSSRGGWLALPLLLPLIWLVAHHQSRKTAQQLLMACATIVAILLLAYAIPATGIAARIGEAASDIQRYLQAQDASTSVGIRLELWKTSLVMFAEHPWLGVGRDQFQSELIRMAGQGLIPASAAIDYSSSHNDALNFLATGGLLDFSFLLLLYGAPLQFFWRAWRTQPQARDTALAGICLVLCFIGFGLTDVMFWLMMTKVFYVMMVCTLAGLCLSNSSKETHDK
jgi:O-antigen ligase